MAVYISEFGSTLGCYNLVMSKDFLDQEEPTGLVEDLGSDEKGKKEISIVIPEVSIAAENLVYIKRSAEKRKDKGKSIMKEDKSVHKKQRIAEDVEIAKQLQEAIAEAASAHDIDWNDSAILRYHALQNRSFSVSEIEKEVMKKSRFDLQQKQFAEEVSEKKDDSSSKPIRGSRKKTITKKRIGAKLDEESAKRQKLKDVIEEEATSEYEKEKEELRVHTPFMDGALMEINMLVEKKYPLIKELLEKMLNLQLEAKEESIMAFELIKFIKLLLEENLFPPLDNPELTIQRRSRADPTILNKFEMAAEGNGDPPVPDLRTIEELCQPSLNGRGGQIAPIDIQATNFVLKNDMIQQV
nr:reverse transcriptase domain-containing protein [Tanacetum cinerariifolium]